jgi:hypothetical protein
MIKQCQAKTNWLGEDQCSRRAKIKVDGASFCIPHAGKVCLQRAIEDGYAEPLNPGDWFYQKTINKKIKLINTANDKVGEKAIEALNDLTHKEAFPKE